jgi:hypothetical protein
MEKKFLYIFILVTVSLGAFLFIKYKECVLYDGIIACIRSEEDKEEPAPELAEREIDNIPNFDKYSVQRTFFVPAPLDLNSNPIGDQFKTKITETYTEKPNFAGQYTIASWGCGASCGAFVVIDNTTGKIYGDYISEKLTDGGSSYGMDFNVDSNLIIINPSQESNPDYFKDMDEYIKENLKKEKDLYPTKYFKWENNELVPIKLTP